MRTDSAIRILLADDHAVVRDGLRAILEGQPDLRVVGDAADGREAVRLAAELWPDVVVMDLAMPELNGVEAMRRIHAQCPSVRVIILSMYSSTEHIYQALQAGARGYLLKEAAGAEVIDAVRAVQIGRRYLSRKISEAVLTDYLRRQEPGDVQSPLARLSPREREILQLVAEGKTSAAIAAHLSLSPKTVETYRSRVMDKLGIHDLPGLVKFAIQHGLTPLS
jgi:DNA-binding NarL/FixJ family response regulator